MPDAMENLAASMQPMGEGDSSGGYLGKLGMLLAPGSESPLAHALALARLGPETAAAVVVLVNSHFRTTQPPRNMKKGSLEATLYSMSDGPRMAILTAITSISLDGQGRHEIVGVLGGLTRMIRRPLGRGRGDVGEGGIE